MSNSADASEGQDLDAPVIDHSDDEFSDDEPLDVGAAMGVSGSGQSDTPGDTEDTTEDADPETTDYPTLVTNAAHGLHDGYLSWDDVSLPDSVDVSWADFESDVEDKIKELADRHEQSEPDEETESEPKPTAVDGVDWGALWEEFGFDTEDACGNLYVSATQLTGAVESSEQNINGDASALISQAVDDGTLHKLTTTGRYGEDTQRGFVLEGGA